MHALNDECGALAVDHVYVDPDTISFDIFEMARSYLPALEDTCMRMDSGAGSAGFFICEIHPPTRKDVKRSMDTRALCQIQRSIRTGLQDTTIELC